MLEFMFLMLKASQLTTRAPKNITSDGQTPISLWRAEQKIDCFGFGLGDSF